MEDKRQKTKPKEKQTGELVSLGKWFVGGYLSPNGQCCSLKSCSAQRRHAVIRGQLIQRLLEAGSQAAVPVPEVGQSLKRPLMADGSRRAVSNATGQEKFIIEHDLKY
ncbi:hypothetical protein H112_07733 [Trichophyton rubrum D6]|uniref:Uncharacterized protein n=2 Tax=Trichophyton TaxID=5550 RepID=A0A022VRI9_TRIRU|nr:hypothetical protein H100_07757 [Trichophyton rubrum MR850]EZF38010.1 hypothetical protein H102_07722 [Trichophyton rubrum CBS 100081]EZF48645.1 hypothetical protein H103_07745 [Trichophyton rubrum CBS 288.86]EZF59331.1 hypothetical protein H104_07694 [Trichophyton rubrum CBS 289.86]EZF69899.1 hypothetical protein H105_07749 [Trichophyton soudanense CBS 452.61]EZF80522.1 hypothetical protein H110_07743 [Trichophyton rubrum MR1448]EZG02350.1 hypothetical protein H106_07580 [Trichophyton rub